MKAADHFIFFLVLAFLLMASAKSNVLLSQGFQKTNIRDIAKMSNNWGNAVADYDQDGDLDIFIVAYESFQPNVPETWSRLLQNNGGNWFEDVTIQAGFSAQYQSDEVRDHKIGAFWGDYDNDGYPDLFLTHEGFTQLYHNDQDGTFSDVSQTSNIGPCTECVNTSALWWDYDRDGDLDLYISDYQNPNRLFNNQGDGTFLNASTGSNLNDPGSTWYSIPIDANQDGWLDLYVINDYSYSRFYLNQAGQYFEEATDSFGLRNTGNGMGATIGDFNQDGHFDIYVTNIAEFQPNALFTGSATGFFQDQNAEWQVGEGHWGWGTRLFDADHDGDEDLYLVNGFGNLIYPNKFFRNMMVEGLPYFTDWSASSQTDGQGQGMGLEVFDYDQDGDLDMLVSNMNEAPYLYNNVGRAPGSNWLQIDLEGTLSNRNAFGSVVKLYSKDQVFQRFYHGSSIMGQSIQAVHFGLGSVKQIDSLVIWWPNSEPETFFNITTNQRIKIVEQSSLPTSLQNRPKRNGTGLALDKLYPNPFHESVSFLFNCRESGTLYAQILNLQGQVMWYSETKKVQPGEFSLHWAGNDQNNTRLPPGNYVYLFRFNNTYLSGTISLLK